MVLYNTYFSGIDRIKDGTGDKLGVCINFTAQFIGGMTVAFYYRYSNFYSYF